MSRLNVIYAGERVGQFLETDKGIFFEYDVLFLRKGLELSPFHLPSRKGVFGPFPTFLNRLPGLFYDSLPDKFGMEVMRRRFEEANRPRPTPLGMLAYQGSRTMGALTYEPIDGEEDSCLRVDLAISAESAGKIVSHEPGKIDKTLIASASTAGGAQPKILVARNPVTGEIRTGSDEVPHGMEPWLVKLTTGRDVARTTGAVEYSYFQMAEEAGLNVPESQLIEDSEGVAHLAIRRFDRHDDDPNLRIHLHSYAGLMHLNFKERDYDYRELFQATLALTKDQREATALFRQMTFNVLTHNHDDHAKNFSFLMDAEGHWRLAPAYDLVFCSNQFGGNWMSVGGRTTDITKEHLMAIGKEFGVRRNEASEIVDQVSDVAKRWSAIAAKSGVFDSYAGIVESALKGLRESLGKAQRHGV